MVDSLVGPHCVAGFLAVKDLSCFIHKGVLKEEPGLSFPEVDVSLPSRLEAIPCIEDHDSHSPWAPSDGLCEREGVALPGFALGPLWDLSADLDRFVFVVKLGDTPLLGKRGGVEAEEVDIAVALVVSSSR